MSDYAVMPKSHWQDILNSVRAKTGKDGLLVSGDVAGEINGISGGYGDIPTYHYAEAGRVIDNIRTFKAAHPNSLIFGAISDIHVLNNDATYEERSKRAIKNAAFALETVGAMSGCDFIANLGDNCWENGIDTDNAVIGARCAMNALVPANERLKSYSLVGNHDTSNSTQKIYDIISCNNSFQNYGMTQIRGFGYDDYADKKVRVICLNTADYMNSKGGCGMSYEQKDFLLRALDLSAKSDCAAWQILLLSHIPLDWNGGDYNFYADLQTILNAYEDGTDAIVDGYNYYALNEDPSRYETYNVTKSSNPNADFCLYYNYSGKNAAKIIANIHGHIHTNKVSKIANTDIARVATANTNPDLNKSESYPTYGDYSISSAEAAKIVKVAGTARDTSATFYCIDLAEQIIYAYGYGADIDRVISYAKEAVIYSVAYSLTNATSSNTSASAVEGSGYTTTLTKTDASWVWESVTVTMGGTNITNTAFNSTTGVITIAEVIGDITITAKAKAPYTNMIDTAGTVDNVRLRSGGNTAESTGFVSGYFPCKVNDVIRVYFPNGDRTKIPTNGIYASCYSDTSGTQTGGYVTGQAQITNEFTHGYKFTIPSGVTATKYAIVAGAPNGAYAGWVVTINEKIPQAPELD